MASTYLWHGDNISAHIHTLTSTNFARAITHNTLNILNILNILCILLWFVCLHQSISPSFVKMVRNIRFYFQCTQAQNNATKNIALHLFSQLSYKIILFLLNITLSFSLWFFIATYTTATHKFQFTKINFSHINPSAWKYFAIYTKLVNATRLEWWCSVFSCVRKFVARKLIVLIVIYTHPW